MGAEPGREYVLTLSCPDKPGIVYAVSSFLVQHSANILASQQYGESPDGRFFMRVHFTVPAAGRGPAQLADLERGFSWVAEAFHMAWQLHDRAVAGPHPDHGLPARPLPERPAVPVEDRFAARRCRRRGVQPR